MNKMVVKIRLKKGTLYTGSRSRISQDVNAVVDAILSGIIVIPQDQDVIVYRTIDARIPVDKLDKLNALAKENNTSTQELLRLGLKLYDLVTEEN